MLQPRQAYDRHSGKRRAHGTGCSSGLFS